MRKRNHREYSTGLLSQSLIRFGAHVSNFLKALVMEKYVESCYGEFSVKECLNLRKKLIQDVGEFHKLPGMLTNQKNSEIFLVTLADSCDRMAEDRVSTLPS